METEPEPRGGDSPSARISTAVVQITRDYTGRGPTKARTAISDEVVSVVLGDVLTKAERKLVDGGAAERVLSLRHEFQTLMRDELVAVVETETKRRVIAFVSGNHIDPDIGIETFVLAPRDENASTV